MLVEGCSIVFYVQEATVTEFNPLTNMLVLQAAVNSSCKYWCKLLIAVCNSLVGK